VAPTLDPLQSMAEPHMAARGVWRNIDGVLQAAAAPRFSTEPGTASAEIPRRGQHTRSVLEWLKSSE
jgi:alpha-methylacyl-CoA racemase